MSLRPCTNPDCNRFKKYTPQTVGEVFAQGCPLCTQFLRFDLYEQAPPVEPCQYCLDTPGLKDKNTRCPHCGGTAEKTKED